MSTEIIPLIPPRGTAIKTSTYVGPLASITVNTDANTIHVHDGSTPGGFALSKVGHQHAQNEIYSFLGYTPAQLGSDGKLLLSQLPKISIIETHVVSSLEAMLALDAQQGDMAIRTDARKTFVLQTNDPSNEDNWIDLPTPTGTVSWVNGYTGPSITLTTGDLDEVTNLFFTAARARAALSVVGTGGSYDQSSGVITLNGQSSAGMGYFAVQIGDGAGGFQAVPQGLAGKVLTSNGVDSPTWEVPQVSGGTVTSVNLSGGATGLTATGGPITTAGTIELAGMLNIAHGGTGASSVAGIISKILPDQTNNAGSALVTDGAGGLSWQTQPGTTYYNGVGLALQGTTFNSLVADNTGVVGRLTVTRGDGTLSNLAAGTDGFVLTSNGSAAAPSWQPISGTISDIRIYTPNEMGLYITGGDAYSPADTQGARHITTTGAIGLAGVLSPLHGGTGQTTLLNSIRALLPGQSGQGGKMLSTDGTNLGWSLPIPPQSGNAGLFLTTNGTTASWSTPGGGGTITSVDISVPSFLNVTGGPITQSGTFAITLSGAALPISSGGTGQTTAAAAINALVPNQSGNNGKVLTTNGNVVSWTTASAGSVTSVAINAGTTGLTFSGGPITEAGTFNVDGVLSVLHGGTGGNSATTAINNLLPSQSKPATEGLFLSSNGINVGWASPLPSQFSNAGKYLTTDGTTASWSTPAGGTVSSVSFDTGTTGLTVSGGPITGVGTFSLAGTLSPANGGTGQTTLSAAINALVPSQTGNAGLVLSTDGTAVSWQPASSGSVTSVAATGGTTGLTFTGGPITSQGTLQLGGTLALSNGGTGATSAQLARNILMPSQSSHAGQYLTTDGTNMSWVSIPISGSVTNVAVTEANGVSASVSDPTNNVNLTFTLGDITPSSVNAGGAVAGASLSVQRAAGVAKTLYFGVGPSTSNSNNRWSMGSDAAAESGASGANFVLSAWNGTGTASQVLTVSRSSQVVDFKKVPTVNGAALSNTNGTVTSIDVSGGTTGLTFTGGPVTTAGVVTLAGTLGIANGGTGAATKTAAFDALQPMTAAGDLIIGGASGTGTKLPIGTTGQVLTSDGTTAHWTAPASTDASALMGTTLAANVKNSSLTSVGTLSSLTVSGITSINGIGATYSATLVTSATTADQVLDASLAIAAFRAVKYQISITSGSAYEYTEVTVMHDGTNVYLTENGTLVTGASLASFTATISGGNLQLQTTPANATTTYKVVAVAIAV